MAKTPKNLTEEQKRLLGEVDICVEEISPALSRIKRLLQRFSCLWRIAPRRTTAAIAVLVIAATCLVCIVRDAPNIIEYSMTAESAGWLLVSDNSNGKYQHMTHKADSWPKVVIRSAWVQGELSRATCFADLASFLKRRITEERKNTKTVIQQGDVLDQAYRELQETDRIEREESLHMFRKVCSDLAVLLPDHEDLVLEFRDKVSRSGKVVSGKSLTSKDGWRIRVSINNTEVSTKCLCIQLETVDGP